MGSVVLIPAYVVITPACERLTNGTKHHFKAHRRMPFEDSQVVACINVP